MRITRLIAKQFDTWTLWAFNPQPPLGYRSTDDRRR